MNLRSRPVSGGIEVAVCRTVLGTVGLLAPGWLQKAALLGRDDAHVRIWTRFWATRAIGLGVGYLAADAPTRHHLVRTGLGVDALDTAFLLAMGVRGRAPRPACLWLAAVTGWAALSDLAEIVADSRSR